MNISQNRIVEELMQMGVRRGDHLAVGVSYKALGRIDGGPDGFVDALLATVGPEGTVMMNTHTRVFLPTEIRLGWTDYVFDTSATPCITGIVAEKFWRKKEALRSRHPTFSVAAIGKYAHFLTDEHTESSESYLPFKKLAEINGKYLAVGIGDKLAGFRHCAQQLAGLLDVVPWKRAVMYKNGSGILQSFVLRDHGGCTHRLPELVAQLRLQGLVTDGALGAASAVLVPAREALENMASALRRNPEINLCKRPLCYWCRELERKLDLYQKIEDPEVFQKNRIAIYALSWINRLRELDNGIAAKSRILLRKRLPKRFLR